jgi:hypothetical protein
VVQVGPSVPITQQPIVTDGIVIRPRLPFLDGDCRDAQRQAADSRLEDAVRGLERNPYSLKGETALQLAPVEQVRRLSSALVQERKGRESNSKIGLIHAQILAVRSA